MSNYGEPVFFHSSFCKLVYFSFTFTFTFYAFDYDLEDEMEEDWMVLVIEINYE